MTIMTLTFSYFLTLMMFATLHNIYEQCLGLWAAM